MPPNNFFLYAAVAAVFLFNPSCFTVVGKKFTTVCHALPDAFPFSFLQQATAAIGSRTVAVG